MNKLSYYLVIILIVLTSCVVDHPELPLWLEGEWKTNNRSGFMGENWAQENDTLISGQGMVHIAGQLRVMEEINIYISDGEMYYTAKVSEQNDGKQIIFVGTYIAPGHLVFENPEHDFPTRIVYKRTDSGTLEVNLSGRDKEDTRVITLFP